MPATMLAQNASVSGAPGKIAAMPTIAMSAAAAASASRLRAALRPRRRAARSPPSLTSRCSSAIVRRRVAQRGDLADHEHALALLRRRRRPSTIASPSRSQALGGDAQPAEVELLELRPRSPAPATPAASSRCFSARERAHVRRCRRSGWRGPARSRAARCARTRPPPAWKPGWIAPHATASCGEQVRGAHQHADRARRARRAARPSPRPSRPSARRGCRRRTAPSSSLRRRRARAGARSAPPTARSSSAARRGRRTRGPRTRSGARRRLQEQVEQARRRHVQVGGDALRPRAARACDGRPPAISATGGAISRTTSSCSSRSSGGTKPRMPTPHGRSPSSARGLAQQRRAPRRRASARARGTAGRRRRRPRRRTRARSLTRVIGPCAIG